jgi:hypothetical protein
LAITFRGHVRAVAMSSMRGALLAARRPRRNADHGHDMFEAKHMPDLVARRPGIVEDEKDSGAGLWNHNPFWRDRGATVAQCAVNPMP